MVKVKVVDRPPADLVVRSWLPELWKGMKVTNRHFWVNLLTRKGIVTAQYPEEKFPYPPRYRGHHRLMRRDDGSVRCVACFCCSTACPADCIHIVAGERSDEHEKYPVVFEVDFIKCIFCGMCEEACPCDAIRLDSGVHRSPSLTREGELCGKEDLLSLGGLSVARQGGDYR